DCALPHRRAPSFPTRRSSDLKIAGTHQPRDRSVPPSPGPANDSWRACRDVCAPFRRVSFIDVSGSHERLPPYWFPLPFFSLIDASHRYQVTVPTITKRTIAGTGLPPRTSRCVAIAPTIVITSSTPPSTSVVGVNKRIAPVTSRPPVKYRNHWPRPILSNIETIGSAPANFNPPAKRNAEAARICKIHKTMFKPLVGRVTSSKATLTLVAISHSPFRSVLI